MHAELEFAIETATAEHSTLRLKYVHVYIINILKVRGIERRIHCRILTPISW